MTSSGEQARSQDSEHPKSERAATWLVIATATDAADGYVEEQPVIVDIRVIEPV